MWEPAFAEKQLIWGTEPTASAFLASDYFARTAWLSSQRLMN
jgi:hypothetical protein